MVILGTGKLAYSRARAAHEAGGVPLVVNVESGHAPCSDIQDGVAAGWILQRDGPTETSEDGNDLEYQWSRWIDDVDQPQDEQGEERRVFAVCVTDTLHSGGHDGEASAALDTSSASSGSANTHRRSQLLYRLCKRRRIPINVADTPTLCDFSFPATHRYPSSSLQIAVTTNGRGCRLAGRIRRDIVSSLPRNVGDAVERVGEMRDLARRETRVESEQKAQGEPSIDYISARPRNKKKATTSVDGTAEEEDLSYDTTPLNSPVPQLSAHDANRHPPHLLQRASSRLRLQQQNDERRKRRMRWVAQISEYWPIEYLGGMKETQMHDALKSFGEEEGDTDAGQQDRGRSNGSSGETQHATQTRSLTPRAPVTNSGTTSLLRGRTRTPTSDADPDSSTAAPRPRARSQHSLSIVPPPPPRASKGHIYLIGSGPGHPGLLTLLAHRLLTSPSTHLILSDKLVPSPILRLIPSTTPLIIAKKFPGNAEGAQSELISLALKAALEEGKNVIRLKQGDPFVYGRGGEEVLAFRKAGMECTVIPGISSALAAPLMLGVPVTQRGSADSLILCTGVGRGGKKVKLPGYERSRSLIVLMGVARLGAVVDVLTQGWAAGVSQASATSDRTGAPFPPYTPIAIIERASSSDQRILTSTLDKILVALDKCGEQRPPGMIMIGWAVLSLEGSGHVDVLEQDESDPAQLEQNDRARVQSWLDGKDYIMREGLDDVYSRALIELSKRQEEYEEQEGQAQVDGGARDQTGWSKGRYQDSVPRGGWGENEGANVAASDPQEYQRHQAYLESVAQSSSL